MAGNIPACATTAMIGALTVTKKQGDKANLSDPPKWRPSGKSEWMLQLMLEALHDGVGDQRAMAHMPDIYISVLHTTGYYLSFIEEEEGWDDRLSETFRHLAQVLLDLRFGIIDPLLKVEGTSKRDSTYRWFARMGVVLALEYFYRSGQAYAQTAKIAAKSFPELENLKRGERRVLSSSILSWRIQFMDGKVPDRGLQQKFKQEYQLLDWVHPDNCRDRGADELERAAQMARRIPIQ
jgi:hypothetical protein